MVFYKIFAILALATIALADEQFSHQHPPPPKPETTSGFNIGKQFNANLNLQKTGQASGSIYALGGFQAGPGPSYYTAANNPDPAPAAAPSNGYFQYDATQVQQPGPTSLFSSSNVNYYAAGAVILGVVLAYAVWVVLFNFGGAAKLKELGEEFDSAKDDKTVPVSKKSRRRRAIQKHDDAARLAQIVLSAIESGACLEKSICLMGSQIGGTAKARLAATILEKLIPKNVQGNSYFITLHRALKGEIDCDTMRCSS